MPTLTISYSTPEERRAYEQAIAFVAEMHQLGLAAPHGGVIDACEGLALSAGRDLLRDTLAAAVQARIDGVEKKVDAPCGHKTRGKGKRPRSVLTAVGKIAVRRAYRVCQACGEGRFPADIAIGIDASFTRRARREICYVGVDNSFDRGEQTLKELKGWSVDSETIRRLCHAQAKACRKAKCDRIGAPAAFAKAPGHRELQIDAGKVNTETGWRDVKLATFAAREPAEPCTSEDFEDRDLPRPSVRHAIAAIEPAEEFGQRCKAEAEKLGLTDPSKLTVLGDGAAWIWNLAGEHFAGAEQTLDLFHATGYLATLARAGFGEDGVAADGWRRRAQRALVSDGWAGVCEFVQNTKAEIPQPAALEAAYPQVANYLSGHQDRMLYAARLRQGASVGSGMIEGAIKQHVGRRIKQTGARWKTVHVGPFVEFISIGQTDGWESYWSGG